MRLALVLIGLAPFAFGACQANPASPADCAYIPGAQSTMGSGVALYMSCSAGPVVQSEQTVIQ